MNVDLLIKENKELNEEKQRYKEMWFSANNSLAKYRKLEKQLGCPIDVYIKATTEGIWYSTATIMKHCYIDVINVNRVTFAMNGTNIWFELKDYKKTWWLESDKSE